jgi:hypothetical protein
MKYGAAVSTERHNLMSGSCYHQVYVEPLGFKVSGTDNYS